MRFPIKITPKKVRFPINLHPKKVRFPINRLFPIEQDGLQFDETEYSSYFCRCNKMIVKDFRYEHDMDCDAYTDCVDVPVGH